VPSLKPEKKDKALLNIPFKEIKLRNELEAVQNSLNSQAVEKI